MTIWQTSKRFVMVGVICAATHNSVLLAADLWHIHYALSCVISYVVVVSLGFALHVCFTFQQSATVHSLWRYCLSMAANYPATLVLLFVICDVGGWPVAIAAPTTTVLLFAGNFIASQWAIVRGPPARHS